jgi:hypothetical protein
LHSLFDYLDTQPAIYGNTKKERKASNYESTQSSSDDESSNQKNYDFYFAPMTKPYTKETGLITEGTGGGQIGGGVRVCG